MSGAGRRINYKEVRQDIEAGLSDEDLKRKYKLTDRGLASLFRKLRSVGSPDLPVDSVVLRTPSIALGLRQAVAAFKRGRRPSTVLREDPRRASAAADWRCPVCKTILDGRPDVCPACGVSLARLPAGSPAGPHRTGRAAKSLRLHAEPRPVTKSLAANINRAALEVRTIVGMVGAVFLLIGVFAPIVSVPGLGSLNYFQVGSVTKGLAVCGHMLVALAVISLGLVILGKQVWLWLPGLGSLVLFLYTYARYRGLTRDLSIRVQYLTSSLESGLAVQPGTAEPPGVSGSLGDQTLSRLPDLVRLDWGWGLLIVGATLLLTAAVLRTRKRLIIEP